MKPIQIKISAFGPYTDYVVIDFTKFYDSGIFLITGDTGSGKTTIFDAICFALFGVASGSSRDKNSFRSDFARDDVKTYVELEFLHKDVVYNINRSLSYMRKKIRGEGYTLVSGDASISYLDTVIVGDKNVTDKCREILGIDCLQFKQISMIAQGEFLKLLYAKSNERADIFRRIFDTYIYRNISDTLKKKYLDKKREYDDISINLNSLKDNLIFEEEKDLNINTEELLELILSEISCDSKIEKEKEKNKKDILSKIQNINNKISNVLMINDSFNSYDECVKKLKILKDRENDVKCNKNIVDSNKKIFEIIMPVFQELNGLKDSYKNKVECLDEKKKLYDRTLKKYDSLLVEYGKLDDYRKKITGLKEKIGEYESKLPLLVEIRELNDKLIEKKNIFNLLRLNELEELLDKFNKNRSIKIRLKNEQDNLVGLKSIYDEVSDKYRSLYNKFINCQAGIIASTLDEGCACPVCGSLDHPNKAKLDSNSVLKEDVDVARNKLDECQKKLEVSSNAINSLRKDLEISDGEILNVEECDIHKEIKIISSNISCGYIDVSGVDIVSIQKDISYMEAQIDSKSDLVDENLGEDVIRNNILKCKNEMEKLEKIVINIIKEHDDLFSEKVSLESFIKILENEIGELEVNIKLKSEQYIDSYTNLGYSDEDDYLKVKVNREVLSKLEEDNISYDQEINDLNSKIEVLKDFIKDKKREDILLLEDIQKDLNIQLSDIELFLKNIHNKININKTIYDKIDNVYQKIKSIEKELVILEDLSNTANGAINGKNKLEFEQYVQASYFDDVLMSANDRFAYMTDSRYLLIRKIESSKISDKLGLELEVFDNYTGKRRDITTLSGGEAFKASLSLALGMSDVIQNYSGGIIVDTMFIDEGFGSLDNDSLEQAMNAIMKISDSNRLIGIISHVNQLKDRIDKKIVVNKGNAGSSVKVIV